MSTPIDTTAQFKGYFPADFVQPEGTGTSSDGNRRWQNGFLALGPKNPMEAGDMTGGDVYESEDLAFGNTEFTVKDARALHDGEITREKAADIKYIYAPEIEELLHNVILRDYNIVKCQCHGAVLKRGPGSKNNFYGTGGVCVESVSVDHAINTHARLTVPLLTITPPPPPPYEKPIHLRGAQPSTTTVQFITTLAIHHHCAVHQR